MTALLVVGALTATAAACCWPDAVTAVAVLAVVAFATWVLFK